MTKIEALELELAARKMVEGTELDWLAMIRHKPTKQNLYNTVDVYYPEDVEIALGIIEGKPVWEDDIIYDEEGDACKAKRHYTYPCAWSWNPPTPKTVMVELTVEDAKWMASAFNSPNPGHPSSIATACRKALEGLK